MKFQITRTSFWDKKPCEEAFEGKLMHVDVRTVNDPNKLNIMTKEEWYGNGSNHRLIDNYIARDLQHEKVWFIEINGLEDLIKLKEKYGELIVGTSCEDKETPCIEIYDDYRE